MFVLIVFLVITGINGVECCSTDLCNYASGNDDYGAGNDSDGADDNNGVAVLEATMTTVLLVVGVSVAMMGSIF